jgi:hypothetical protein
VYNFQQIAGDSASNVLQHLIRWLVCECSSDVFTGTWQAGSRIKMVVVDLQLAGVGGLASSEEIWAL